MSVEEIFQTMRELVAEQFAMEPAEVSMETAFEEDLGADSVDLVELVMAMEEEFEVGEIQEEDLGSLKTVGDAVNYIAAKVK
nr:acyl carrier protein [uncultured Oscillibacter sp.]